MAMSYEEFLDAAKDAAKTRHPEADVTIQKVEKLQGESYVGLSVSPEGQNTPVTMNLHDLHGQVVENPKRLAAVMSEFLSSLDKAISQIPQVDTKQFTEYENVKGNLMMQVIPVEPNKEKLEQVPHKIIEDIAVVYRIDVSDSRHHNASVLVTNQMMEHFGITPEQLHQDAVASQMANRPPTLKNMSVLLVEPEKYPRPVEIGTDLEDLQKAVGGYIEVTYPFDENVGLVMNPLPIIQNQIYCNSQQYDLDQISRELLYIQLALAI